MIKFSLAIVLLAFGFNLPSSAQERQDDDPETVVITGTRLSDLRSKLQQCLVEKCPPKQDIEASLAFAEGQFLEGDYAGARGTLSRARGRNNRFAATLPVEVSDLNRAYGRIANLDGRPDTSRLAQITSLDALKAGLDKDDTRVFMQRIMVGDEFAFAGRLKAAEDVYRQVARQARKAGKIRAAGYAMFREAVVYGALASVRRMFHSSFEARVERLERTQEPELADFRYAAKVLRAQLIAFDRDADALNKAIALLPPRSADAPVLIYAPTIRVDEFVADRASISGNSTPKWLDLRFRIAADGTVHQIEVLRDSGDLADAWPRRVRESVAGRRYAPLNLPVGSSGPSRVERFTYVHDLMLQTGSRLYRRKPQGRVRSLDLTATTDR